MLVKDIKARLLADFCIIKKIEPALKLTDVTWGEPEIWIEGDCNTRITITVKESNLNHKGSVTLYYKRQSIVDVLHGILIPGKQSDYNGLYDIIDILNTRVGIPIDRSEFFNTPINSDLVTLRPAAGAIAFIPSISTEIGFSGK